MHLSEQFKNLHEVFLEASEYALGVLTGPLVSVKTIHTVGDGMLGKLSACTTYIVVVDVHHAELRLELHGLWEKGD